MLSPSPQPLEEQGFVIEAQSTSFGRVVLASRPRARWGSPCPVAGQPPSCAFVTVGRWKQRPAPYPFPEEAEIEAWTAPVAVEPGWQLAGGSSAAYLTEVQPGLALAVVDERGSVAPVFALPPSPSPSFAFAQVVDTSGGASLVAIRGGSTVVEVAEIARSEGGQVSLGAFFEIPIDHARARVDLGPDAYSVPSVWGGWSASPVLDSRGKLTDRIDLTWRDRTGARRSVRFTSQGRVVGRSPSRPRAAAAERAPVIERVLPSPPPLLGPPPQQIEGAGFDEASREGLVVWRESAAVVAQPIDERGRPSGDASRSQTDREPRAPWLTRLARSAAGWGMVENGGARLSLLTGPRAGTTLELPAGMRRGAEGCDGQPSCVRFWGEVVGLFPDGSDLVVAYRDRERRSDVWLARVDVAGARAGEPVLEEAGGHDGPFVDEVVADLGAPGSPMLLGHSVLGLPLVWRKASGWAEVAMPDEARHGRVSWRRLHGVWAAVVEAPGGAFASWLGQGVVRAIGRASWTGLPSAADGLVATGVLPEALAERCPSSVATGPRRRVFFCEEATSTERPMVAVTSREARFLGRARA